MAHLAALLLLASSLIAKTQAGDLFDNANLSLEKLFDVAASTLFGLNSQSDSLVTPKYYKTFLMNDNTNEDIATHSVEQILARSGYQYENHYVTSDDGYITNLIRIVNPLADASQLKQPPVMVMHGGVTDSSLWVWSSAIQHHPEKYPRVAEDGPITSWNKSLAFVLANNGYDVWLVGTRGSNIQNKRHAKLTKHYNWFDVQQAAEYNVSLPGGGGGGGGRMFELSENLAYWNFTMDDIGQFEVPRQQEKILHLTGSPKVTLIDASLSTQIDLALMSENSGFVSRLHNYVTFAPIVNRQGVNWVMRTFHETIGTRVPVPIGIILAQLILSPPTRGFMSSLRSFRELRYLLVKRMIDSIAGSSAKYETNLDSGLVGHIFESTGYLELRHYCQQVQAGRLQKFDHGPSGNLRIYGSPEAPKYELANIELPHWMLFSGGKDNLATVSSVKQVLKSIKRQPTRHYHIERYNHLDLFGGVECDNYVNLPVLNFLDQFALDANGR